MLALAAMVNGIYQNNGMAAVLKTTVTMSDAAHALVYGKASAAQTQVTGPVLLIDAGSSGVSETLTLPAEANSNGAVFLAINTGGEEVVINNDGAALVCRLRVGGRQVLVCDGTTWYALDASSGSGLQTWGAVTIDMADAAHTLTLEAAGAGETQLTGNLLFVDANGAGTEILTLPAEADSTGLVLFIFNTGGETIQVDSDAPATVVNIATTESAILACDGTTWYAILGTATPS